MAKKAPTAKQLAARKRFAAAARAGTLRKGTKLATNPKRRKAARRNPVRPALKARRPVKRAVQPIRAANPKRRTARGCTVEAGNGSTWRKVATFVHRGEGESYAKALHKSNPGLFVRVK